MTYPDRHTGLHVGEQAWATLRKRIKVAAKGQPWESNLTALTGVSVYIEPGWDSRRWELVERGQVISSGTIGDDGSLMPDVRYVPGRAIVEE